MYGSRPAIREAVMKNTLRIFTLFLSASLAFAGSGSKSAASVLSPDLQNLAPNTKVTVLIQFSSKPSQAMLSIIAGQGATTNRQFRHVPFVTVTEPAVPPRALRHRHGSGKGPAGAGQTAFREVYFAGQAGEAPPGYHHRHGGRQSCLAVRLHWRRCSRSRDRQRH